MTADADKTNVLIVDDLPDKLLAYQSVLEGMDLNLVTARSGGEALRHVLQQDFAVILLDVNMPGMDGLETAALVRKRKKSAHTPIIFITSFADEVRVAQGYAHGAVDYILAPVVPEVLRAKVSVFVDLFRMTQQVRRQAEERIALAEERARREAAEESNLRLAFLARAGAVLGQSLDDQVTVREVARLPVPFVADLAAVVLAEGPGAGWTLTLARSGDDGTSLEEGADPGRLPEELAAAVERVLAGGPAESFPGAGAAEYPAAVVLPLRARGRTFGVLALSRASSRRHFGPAELSVAEALASRSAAALDNARLYKDVQEADRQKNEFLSMLAHELRNPLAPIRNAVQVLRLCGQEGPEQRWAQEVIDRQVQHMVRLVDDLLDISRITRGKICLKLEPVEVSAVVAQAVEVSRPVIDAQRHQLEVSLPDEPAWVSGDAARLAQVLSNLLNNAAKYTEEGGRVWLSAGREGGAVVFRVRDTGVGIPPEMLSAVFDLFTQVDRSLDRSQGGLGIGLTLSRRLVEMHGGTVQAFSDGPGRGSEFIVRLPALASRPQAEAADGGAEARPGSRCRVLVVDDNVDAAASLALLLRLGGHEVRLAHDGPAALEEAQAFRPDAILLDIGLPGMDGYEVARRLRSHPATAGACLLAVTGYGQEEDRLRSAEAGFDCHLVKPVDPGTLREVLASLPGGAEPGKNGRPLHA